MGYFPVLAAAADVALPSTVAAFAVDSTAAAATVPKPILGPASADEVAIEVVALCIDRRNSLRLRMLRWPKSVKAISISSRQFHFHHDNFNFITAISTSLTAISISSRQFQFNFTTALSILSWHFLSTCLRTGNSRLDSRGPLPSG